MVQFARRETSASSSIRIPFYSGKGVSFFLSLANYKQL